MADTMADKAATAGLAAVMAAGALGASVIDNLGGVVGEWGPAGVLVTTVVASSRMIVRAQSRAAEKLTEANRVAVEITDASQLRVVADLEAAVARRDRQIAELHDTIGKLNEKT